MGLVASAATSRSRICVVRPRPLEPTRHRIRVTAEALDTAQTGGPIARKVRSSEVLEPLPSVVGHERIMHRGFEPHKDQLRVNSVFGPIGATGARGLAALRAVRTADRAA